MNDTRPCGYLDTGPECQGTYASLIGDSYDYFQYCYIGVTVIVSLTLIAYSVKLFAAKGFGFGMTLFSNASFSRLLLFSMAISGYVSASRFLSVFILHIRRRGALHCIHIGSCMIASNGLSLLHFIASMSAPLFALP
jgi:hypothetical protein